MIICALTFAAGIVKLLGILPDIYSDAVDTAANFEADGFEYCMGSS